MFILKVRKKIKERVHNTYFSVEPLFSNEQKLLAVLAECSRPKVLSIDASKVCQKNNVTLLKKLNCSVVSAETACVALARLSSPYRIIFLDSNLPDLCGELLVRFIRNNKQSLNKNTPIIVTTNWLEESFERNYFSMGINEIFIKPITMKNFRNILQQYGVPLLKIED